MPDTEICEELPMVLPTPSSRLRRLQWKNLFPVTVRWSETTAQDLSEATDILDQLENSGVAEMTLELNGVEGFVVRWK